jgi:CopG family transcriptional regulator/antitoxin EndoAI
MQRSNAKAKLRVNVSLPEETLTLLDQTAKQGERSALIAEAITAYLRERGRKALRHRLKQGAVARSERDLHLAEEWFLLEEGVWERSPPTSPGRRNYRSFSNPAEPNPVR